MANQSTSHARMSCQMMVSMHSVPRPWHAGWGFPEPLRLLVDRMEKPVAERRLLSLDSQ